MDDERLETIFKDRVVRATMEETLSQRGQVETELLALT